MLPPTVNEPILADVTSSPFFKMTLIRDNFKTRLAC